MKKIYTILVIGISVVLIICAIICGYYSYIITSQTSKETQGEIEVSALHFVSKSMEEAKKWKSDAVLIGIAGYPSLDGKATRWFYRYTSPSVSPAYTTYIIEISFSGEINCKYGVGIVNYTQLMNLDGIIDSDVAMKIAREHPKYQEFFSYSSESETMYQEMQLYIPFEFFNGSYLPVWEVTFVAQDGLYLDDFQNCAVIKINATSGRIIHAENAINGYAYHWYTPAFRNPCFTLCLFPLILFCVFVIVPVIVWRIKKKYGYKKEKKAYEELKRRWEMEEKKNGRVLEEMRITELGLDHNGYGWGLSSKAESTKTHTVVLDHLNPAEDYDYYIVATTVVDGQTYTASYGSREQPHSFTTETAITVLQVEDYYEPARDENGVRVYWETGDDGEHTYRVEVIKEGIPKYMMEVSEQGKCHMVEIPVGQKVIPNTTYDFKVTVIDVGIEKTIENIKASEDYDGDGLSDAEENVDWEVPGIYFWEPSVDHLSLFSNGGRVTADPGNQDYDNDGWNDREEKSHKTKPSPSAPPMAGGGHGKPPLICSLTISPLDYDPNTLPYIDGADTDADGVKDPEDYKKYNWAGNWDCKLVRSPLVKEPRRHAIVVGLSDQFGGTSASPATVSKWKDFLEGVGWSTTFLLNTDATKENVKNAFMDAITFLGSNDILSFIIVSHGAEDNAKSDGYIQIYNSRLYASEVKDWLSTYKGYFFGFIDACNSGYFTKIAIPGNIPSNSNTRIVLTSANLHTSTFYLTYPIYHAFSYAFLVKGLMRAGKSDTLHPDNPNYNWERIWTKSKPIIATPVVSYFFYVDYECGNRYPGVYENVEGEYVKLSHNNVPYYPYPLCQISISSLSQPKYTSGWGGVAGIQIDYSYCGFYLWWEGEVTKEW